MTQAICQRCGEPMPEGEEMFKFHGESKLMSANPTTDGWTGHDNIEEQDVAPMTNPQKIAVELPVEAFALLIKSAAQAIINELEKPASKVDATFLYRSVGTLDELVHKFDALHQRGICWSVKSI